MDLRHKLPIIAWVYIIEGFPMGVHDLWAIYLRRHEASLAEVGLLASLRFAWTLKVLWSPLIDRFGERRQWICGSMAAMSAALVCIAASDPQPVSAFLWATFWCYCLASATQDVAIDAYSIGLTDRGEEGPVNSTKAMGYRAGMLLATAGLLLPRWIGWSATFMVGAAISAAMAAGVFRAPRVAARAAQPDQQPREAVPPGPAHVRAVDGDDHVARAQPGALGLELDLHHLQAVGAHGHAPPPPLRGEEQVARRPRASGGACRRRDR